VPILFPIRAIIPASRKVDRLAHWKYSIGFGVRNQASCAAILVIADKAVRRQPDGTPNVRILPILARSAEDGLSILPT
jgi:hypothetical protein